MGGQPALSKSTRRTLLLLSITLVAIGNCGGPLLARLYFVKGGTRVWLSCFLQSCGFPLTFIPLLLSYFHRRKINNNNNNTNLMYMQLPTFLSATLIGLFLGTMNYLFSFATSRVPVSTTTLIMSTQLAFTALSAFILVKQKFTSYSINAVVLLTVGAAALALHASSDRPEGERKKEYIMGFILLFVASGLSGLIFPLLELVYMKATTRQGLLSCSLVMEIQMVMAFAASVFALIGMLVNNDFQAIPREAKAFEMGEVKYYVVVVSNAIIWQLFTLGAVGIVFCSSALVSGVIVSVLLPVSQVLAVIFFHDKFSPEKGISLVLCLWGFVSYFYGEYKQNKKNNQILVQESATNTPNIAPTIHMEP